MFKKHCGQEKRKEIMNKQTLLNQVMAQLTKDKELLALLEQLQLDAPSATHVEEPRPVYYNAAAATPASDLPQPYFQFLQKTVQATLEAVQVALVDDDDTQPEQFIARSFERFDEVYKALS